MFANWYAELNLFLSLLSRRWVLRDAEWFCVLFRNFIGTGLNVLAKNRRNWQVNFIDSGLEVAKTRFQTFLRGKSVLFKWKCQIREFHAQGIERGEVLKRYCGWQRRLRFWNKHHKIELLSMQLAHYNKMHARVLKYQKTIPRKLANK